MEQERLWTLLGKKLAGIATHEELQELDLLLLAYGEEAGTIEILERMWSSRKKKLDPADDDPIRSRIEKSLDFSRSEPVQKETKKTTGRWIAGALAACALGVICFGIFRKTRTTGKEDAMNVLFTKKKSHSNLQLPDGTLVVLNENSRISYNADFGRTRREIILEGEAYFDVAKDPETPLIIHAGHVDIRVLGTTFNVKAYPNERNVETSLIKGAVEVSSKNFPQQKVLLRPNEKIAIPANVKEIPEETIPDENPNLPQNAPDSNAGTISPAQIKTSVAEENHTDTLSYRLQPLKAERSSKLIPEIAWIYRKLVFNQESFETVAEKMERWYDVNIYFEDDDLKKEIFTGSFNKETLEQALKALQFTYHFTYIIKKKEVFIKKKQPNSL